MSVDWYQPKLFRRPRSTRPNPPPPKKNESCGLVVSLFAIYGATHFLYSVAKFAQSPDAIPRIRAFLATIISYSF